MKLKRPGLFYDQPYESEQCYLQLKNMTVQTT